MAQASLKNAGVLDILEIDFTEMEAIRLAFEKVGKDLWNQIYLVIFFKQSGDRAQAVLVQMPPSKHVQGLAYKST